MKSALSWSVVVGSAAIVGVLLNSWLMSQPFMQAKYVHPMEMQFDTGMLIMHGVFMVILFLGGILLGWRIEKEGV